MECLKTNKGDSLMKNDLKTNYISLGLSVLLTLFLGFMYFLLGKSMNFPLKVGYSILVLAFIILIFYNIIAIVRKANSQDK